MKIHTLNDLFISSTLDLWAELEGLDLQYVIYDTLSDYKEAIDEDRDIYSNIATLLNFELDDQFKIYMNVLLDKVFSVREYSHILTLFERIMNEEHLTQVEMSIKELIKDAYWDLLEQNDYRSNNSVSSDETDYNNNNDDDDDIMNVSDLSIIADDQYE
ncbi:MAG: hypothetical protein AB8B67_03435 [Rickettsiaceae bacterium]